MKFVCAIILIQDTYVMNSVIFFYYESNLIYFHDVSNHYEINQFQKTKRIHCLPISNKISIFSLYMLILVISSFIIMKKKELN